MTCCGVRVERIGTVGVRRARRLLMLDRMRCGFVHGDRLKYVFSCTHHSCTRRVPES